VISARDIRGYYGSVGYRLTPKLEGVLRYDYLDANRDLGGDTEVRDIIAGLNYYIKGNNAKIQVNVLRRNGAEGLGNSVSNPSSDIQNDRTELRANFQVAF
jgi:phosphate-selective porin